MFLCNHTAKWSKIYLRSRIFPLKTARQTHVMCTKAIFNISFSCFKMLCGNVCCGFRSYQNHKPHCVFLRTVDLLYCVLVPTRLRAFSAGSRTCPHKSSYAHPCCGHHSLWHWKLLDGKVFAKNDCVTPRGRETDELCQKWFFVFAALAITPIIWLFRPWQSRR